MAVTPSIMESSDHQTKDEQPAHQSSSLFPFPTQPSQIFHKTEQHQQQQVNCSVHYIADFASSWTAFAAALLITHPIETLRVRRQTHNQTVAHTFRTDGFRSLYKGFFTPLLANGPLFAHGFAMNELCKCKIRQYFAVPCEEPLNMPQLYLAGFLAGATVTPIACPFDVVRLQQQVAGRRAHTGAVTASGIFREMHSTIGIARGLYRGVSLSLFCSAVGRGCYFSMYETLKSNERFKRLTTLNGTLTTTLQTQVLAAILASWSGWLSMFPGDVLRNKIQSDGFRDKTTVVNGVNSPSSHIVRYRTYDSIRHCARITYKEGGVRAFYAGLPLTLLRGIFSSGISLPLFDSLKPLFREHGASFV